MIDGLPEEENVAEGLIHQIYFSSVIRNEFIPFSQRIRTMFCSSIKSLDADRPTLPKALLKGLDYLKNTDFSKMETGKYEIEGALVYVLVQEYQTQPREAKKAESHMKYIDVQFVYSGIEAIGYAPAYPGAEVLENLVDKKDMITYKSVSNETMLVLGAGMYAVLFPGEIHRPQCNYLGEVKVRKVVLKVAMELLK
jgi:biofilm protein TabA